MAKTSAAVVAKIGSGLVSIQIGGFFNIACSNNLLYIEYSSITCYGKMGLRSLFGGGKGAIHSKEGYYILAGFYTVISRRVSSYFLLAI